MTNPFKKSEAAARERGSHSTANRIKVEGMIADFLVTKALTEGFWISVFDGEEDALDKSQDKAAILNAMFSTDEDELTLYHPNGDRFGAIKFIYGNSGYDVIADYGAAQKVYKEFDAWMAPVNAYCETLET